MGKRLRSIVSEGSCLLRSSLFPQHLKLLVNCKVLAICFMFVRTMVWDMGKNSNVCVASSRHTCFEFIPLPETCPGRTDYGATPSPTTLTLFLRSVSSFWQGQDDDTDQIQSICFTLKIQALPLRPVNTDSKDKFWQILCHFKSSSELLQNAIRIITTSPCFLW